MRSDLNLILSATIVFDSVTKPLGCCCPQSEQQQTLKNIIIVDYHTYTMVECQCYYLRSYRTRQFWSVVVKHGKLVVNNSNLDLKTCRFQSYIWSGKFYSIQFRMKIFVSFRVISQAMTVNLYMCMYIM